MGFFDQTSIHGIRYIFGHYDKLLKILWALLFLTCFSFMTWRGVTSIQQYLQNNVTVSMVYQPFDVLDFPAVTICNENMFLRDKLGAKHGEMTPLLDAVSLFVADWDPKVSEEVTLQLHMNRTDLVSFHLFVAQSTKTDHKVLGCYLHTFLLVVPFIVVFPDNIQAP